MGKKITVLCLAAIMIFVFGLIGCSRKASKYTELEHIERVTERIQARYIDGDEALRYDDKPIDFTVCPLYNENDELKYFLVEFEPYGFLYVALRDEKPFYTSLFGKSNSMYTLAHYQGEAFWSCYTVDEINSQPYPDGDKIWELDKNGEKIVRKNSPYSVRGVESACKYLLKDNNGIYAPAVKENGIYKNLISMDELIFIDGDFTKPQAEAFLFFPIDKKYGL